MKDENKEYLGSEVRATVHEASDCKVVINSSPNIRELVSDLDKSWGNSKEWMLRLRDGRQIVIPLSLYRSPESVSDCSVTDVETVTSIDSFINDGQMVSWAEDCDGLVDSVSIMALQEKLDRFKKQQEKCQSTLTSIAASNKAETHKSMPVPAAPSVARAPAPATRQAFTPEQINEVTYVDINANKAVFDSLRNNLKVNYDGKRFSYKSKHDLRDKEQLLYLIRKFVWGIAVIDLKDAYPTVMEDLQALKAAGQIWLLSNFDSQEDIAYPNDPRVPIKVDDDLKQLFLGIELPRDMIDIERDLQKNGMKPATNTAQRRASSEVQGMSSKPKPKKKKHEITKRTKLTNAHLPELFRHLDKKS
ncbi:general transcription factor iie subunit 2 [Quercus suber]|uniref:General transcription factor iie subunit 2 n=1 Tax=Quercus suber TaxID=58331 RepID=A0AAW0LHJ0_QUESU